jgi:hypothetical protein
MLRLRIECCVCWAQPLTKSAGAVDVGAAHNTLHEQHHKAWSKAPHGWTVLSVMRAHSLCFVTTAAVVGGVCVLKPVLAVIWHEL